MLISYTTPLAFLLLIAVRYSRTTVALAYNCEECYARGNRSSQKYQLIRIMFENWQHEKICILRANMHCGQTGGDLCGQSCIWLRGALQGVRGWGAHELCSGGLLSYSLK